MIVAFLHGFVLAFGLILPLGPQNAFVLAQGSVQSSLMRAAPVVVAAGCCDSLLILLAVGGVSVAVAELAWLRLALTVGGIAFLLVAGLLSWKSAPAAASDETAPVPLSLRRQVAFAVAFSLGNPHAILDTIGVIGTSSLAYQGGAKIAFAGACIAVSWLWFAILALSGRMLGRIDAARRFLGRASAVVMWVCAIYLARTLL